MQKPLFTLLLLFAVAVPTASAQLVTPRGGAPEILVPVAGSVAGANGTFFRSDISLINYRGTAQRVFLYWLPQGSSGTAIAPLDVTIPALSGIISEDFVAAIMHMTGLGAIVIRGVTTTGQFDTGARLQATSRIWTPQPNATTGTNSQSLPTIGTDDVNALSLAIVGMRRDDRYRTNVGIVNLDSANVQTYQLRVGNGTSTELSTVVVQPFSMQQVAIPGVNAAPLQIVVTNISSNRLTPFVAYASSIDNVTGDSWSSLGFVPSTDQTSTP